MITTQGPCVICKASDAGIYESQGDYEHVDCPQCGVFKISRSALAEFMGYFERQNIYNLMLIRGWIHDQNNIGTGPFIRTSDLKRIMARPLPTISERADKILLEALADNPKIDAKFDFLKPGFMGASYSTALNEVVYLAKHLHEIDMIDYKPSISNLTFILKPLGHSRCEELRRGSNDNSTKAFVAMWFNEEMDLPYQQGIQIGIEKAGYEPVRVDGIQHVNKICDEIIAAINSAKFVVADFTGDRGGVYYEAGYAMGRGLPVIWTCRGDHLDGIHFDIRQYNCIVWDKDKPEELATALNNRIRAICNPGPHAD